jgi:spermidine synthase
MGELPNLKSLSHMHLSPKSFSKIIPYLCLFISGAASLTYELVWVKQLTLIFGGTLYAISAVLCAFMTGLALGAWAISRYINVSKRKINYIRLYGVLEGLIGLYGLIFPFALKGLKLLYPNIASTGLQTGEAVHMFEFGLSTLLMFPATLLMGATLPVLGSWAIKGNETKIFNNISFLYALNTFGAVAGCLYTQFFAIKIFGISGTTLTAVVMNLLVLAFCFAINSKQGEESQIEKTNQNIPNIKIKETKSPEPSRFMSFLLLAIFTYSGLVSLSSEILWTRILVFPLGSSLYSFAIILATFLFGIAFGSLVAEKLIGKSGWIVKFLSIELTIGIYCIAIIPVFELLPELTTKADSIFYDLANTPYKTLFIRTAFAFGLMFLPALGFGLIFPLANQINFSLFRGITSSLGNSYAFNTMGAILGTALTPFLFIPLLGIRLSLFFLYAVLILLCSWALVTHLRFNKTRIAGLFITIFIVIFVGYKISNPNISSEKLGKQNFARVEINVPEGQTKLIDYKEGNFSTLSVMEDQISGARTLYVDGFSTATVSNSIGGSAYMQAMGFIPMLLHPNPKNSLVMCFGTGNTMGTVSLFPDNEVDGVELDANVLTFAHWFSKWNHDVLNKENVAITIQDARNYIEWTKKRYDVITLEPMSPVQAGVTNLYSKEFYENSLKALNDKGIMMQWLPLHLVGPAEAKAIIKTFKNVFPHTTIWNSFLTRIVLLVGSNSPVTLDKNRFDEVMSYPELRSAAEQIGIRSFIDIMDFYLTDATKIKNFIKSGEEITDNFPILEHSPVTLLPPLKKETDETFINILLTRIDIKPPLSGLSNEERNDYLDSFNLRTAQRLSIFSQRYNGPGKESFSAKEFNAGLNEVKTFLGTSGKTLIRLGDNRWEEISN